MTFVITTLNYRLYFNQSGGDRIVSVAASGQARFEVKTAAGAQVSQLQTGALGGIASVRVPPQHILEIDGPPSGVQIEVQVTE